MPGLGHLAHEERPAETAALIVDFARRCGVLPPA
jgi:pimeloyl-ACP methyl ester carboxylesterase